MSCIYNPLCEAAAPAELSGRQLMTRCRGRAGENCGFDAGSLVWPQSVETGPAEVERSLLLDSIRCSVARSGFLVEHSRGQRGGWGGGGTLRENRRRALIDKAAILNKHRTGCKMRAKRRKERRGKKGESQRSNALSGMPKKSRVLASDLIKTRRIVVIIAISKPEQRDSDDRRRSEAHKPPPLSQLVAHL